VIQKKEYVEIMKRVIMVAGIKLCKVMLNRSLEEGIFRNEWKAIVIPKIQRTKK